MNGSGTRQDRPGSPPQARLLAVGLLLYGLAVASYFVLRYAGQWAEGDTARITQAIEAVQAQGTIHPTGFAYQHGYGYQSVSVAVLAITGLDPQTLQTVVYPLLAALGLGITALAFFYQVARNWYVAALGALFLFLQPDVLFVTLRGSHEKLDWPLMMIALTLLYGSVHLPPRKLAIHVALFYGVVFGMIATNVFFASTFLAAITVSLILGLALVTVRKQHYASNDLRRLTYVAASGGVLVFIFMVYVYPLALANLRLLETIADQVSALLLGFEIQSQPYAYIANAWISQEAYLGLTAFTWLLIAASALEWLRRGRDILTGREGLSLRESLDWLLYAGFALQVAASVLVDFAGVLGANLQLRVFPGFTVVAVIVLARGVWRLVSAPDFRGWARRAALIVTGLAVAWFSLASVFKATIEPLWSNKWMFYSVPEFAGLRWAETYVREASIWTGFDERLIVTQQLNYGPRSTSGNRYAAFSFNPEMGYVLWSENERLLGLRRGLAMPPVLSQDRVYDNGDVQLYHRRALSPYQR